MTGERLEAVGAHISGERSNLKAQGRRIAFGREASMGEGVYSGGKTWCLSES